MHTKSNFDKNYSMDFNTKDCDIRDSSFLNVQAD